MAYWGGPVVMINLRILACKVLYIYIVTLVFATYTRETIHRNNKEFAISATTKIFVGCILHILTRLVSFSST